MSWIKRRTNPLFFWDQLCVLASGSFMIWVLNCFTFTRCSLLYFGQNNGWWYNTVSSHTFVLVFPPHTGQGIHWFYKEYSMHPPFYYQSTGDETNVICLDTLVSVTGIDIYFVATSFSSVRNFINSSSVNVVNIQQFRMQEK